MIDHYDWPGGREAMMRFGPAGGPVVVAALPLFEEANRTRAFMVTILRGLASRGIASALPDLPGQGESLLPTGAARLAAMRNAFAAVPGAYTIAIRSGALLDAGARKGRWHLAPQPGADLVRELERVRQAGEAEDFAGNIISPEFLVELVGAEPDPARVVRLESDARPADLTVPGAPQWRRAEPDNDLVLAALLADDIAAWIRACEG
ncbi:hypothetical protein OF829_14245 [Sphingomonas sp. LB-2]|uniref:hypothetical protein n=1 Tax=Sphingomonas caeni TaxID=2984949 RepID=UPI002231A267|nr:hypothetical protein [Sphingomonas caeni]MCW3848401.1 hypothetical protein [Sphingomonas caeni]